MLFNSFTYALFLTVTVAIYWWLPDHYRKSLLLGAGCLFYGAWKLEGLALMIVFVVANWLIGKRLEASPPEQRRTWLAVGIGLNLSTLAFFKYTNFFLTSAAEVFGWTFAPLNIILPLGISFVVFEAISFLMDIYRGNGSIRDFQSFALYISFFPHLIAGPIVRIGQFVPQTLVPKHFDRAQFWSGIDLLCLGALKKVVLADNLAPLVDAAFTKNHASAWDLWLTGCLFAFQIYLDFSGYTDMACGAARLLGYELPINFNFPYLASSIADFWRRWHITLSNWLRDYLYISLGGNRGGLVRTCVNLMITMTLGGLWHGAGWTYLLWGIYQGIALVVHRLCAQLPFSKAFFEGRAAGRVAAWGITYLSIVVGWLIFRAHDGAQVVSWFTMLLTPTAYSIVPEYLLWSPLLAAGLVGFWLLSRSQTNGVLPLRVEVRPLGYLVTVLLLTIFAPQSQQFIYFQF